MLTPCSFSERISSQQFDAGLRVEAVGRLVEDGDARVLHHDLGEPQPLAHAAREGRDLLVGDRGQADAIERGGDALARAQSASRPISRAV